MIFPILELRPAKTSLGRFAFLGARMFDASPEDDPPPENIRAVITVVITYDGEVAAEIQLDAGDEALIADQLRTIADDVVRDARPHRRN